MNELEKYGAETANKVRPYFSAIDEWDKICLSCLIAHNTTQQITRKPEVWFRDNLASWDLYVRADNLLELEQDIIAKRACERGYSQSKFRHPWGPITQTKHFDTYQGLAKMQGEFMQFSKGNIPFNEGIPYDGFYSNPLLDQHHIDVLENNGTIRDINMLLAGMSINEIGGFDLSFDYKEILKHDAVPLIHIRLLDGIYTLFREDHYPDGENAKTDFSYLYGIKLDTLLAYCYSEGDTPQALLFAPPEKEKEILALWLNAHEPYTSASGPQGTARPRKMHNANVIEITANKSVFYMDAPLTYHILGEGPAYLRKQAEDCVKRLKEPI
jgi:hypothetical protein